MWQVVFKYLGLVILPDDVFVLQQFNNEKDLKRLLHEM